MAATGYDMKIIGAVPDRRMTENKDPPGFPGERKPERAFVKWECAELKQQCTGKADWKYLPILPEF